MHSPQLPRELLADGKQHGQLMFVSDNCNQLTKLENFGENVFFSVGKRNRMTAFLNKRNCKKENFLLNIRRGRDSYRIKASKHGS